MSEVVITEWVGSDFADVSVDLGAIEAAIASSGLRRDQVGLRLSLNSDNCYEDGDWPSPVLQLVRPETPAEHETREREEAERSARVAVWPETFMREYLAEMAANPRSPGP